MLEGLTPYDLAVGAGANLYVNDDVTRDVD
jgi:hypothetical protein